MEVAGECEIKDLTERQMINGVVVHKEPTDRQTSGERSKKKSDSKAPRIFK